MRILQVSSARNLGGGETHVIELTEKLRERGHDVLVAGRASGPLNADITLPLRNSADFLSALKLRTILRDRKIDTVHAHVARDYTIVAAAAWGVPEVAVVFTRHLLYPVKRHALYRRVDGWLAPTSQILKTLEPLRPKRSAVIPNWVDIRKFPFRPHDPHRPVNIGILGQISPHKGHTDAVEAMRLLGSGFRLLIAGKGEGMYVDELHQQSTGLPVEFLGFVSLPVFFDRIDILAVPSWEEPFGIVLLEAMASGIPIVATAAGGPLDIIRSGEHGLLVPPRNPASIADSIRQLTENDFLRRSNVKAARLRVQHHYDIHSVIPMVEEFYYRTKQAGLNASKQSGPERFPLQ
jgi:glycosyltransferase involved in cell wall biosynthesis